MNAPAILTALKEEATCLRGLEGVVVRHGGIGPERATRAARALLEEGCTALVSCGYAGGLDPALAPGALVLAESVVAPDGSRHATHGGWRENLAQRLAGEIEVTGGVLAGSAVVLRTPRDKALLHQATGAVAVDMESHAIATVAARAGVPFLVVRAISDGADGVLPAIVGKGMTADGRRRLGPVLLALALAPGHLPELIRLMRTSGQARQTLTRVGPHVGPTLGTTT